MTALILFGSAWCQPCKAMRPVAQKVAEMHELQFQYVDIEKDPEGLTAKFGVRSVPTLVLAKDGHALSIINGNISLAGLIEAVSEATEG